MKNKKSFVLYCDLIHTVKQLPNDKAGKLFKHILNYVNDKNPITKDIIINIAFEPIKQQLKRDLVKYKSKREQYSEAGKKSAEARKQRKLQENQQHNENQQTLTNVESRSTKSTVTVNDNVNVTVNDIKEETLFPLKPIKKEKKKFIPPTENQVTEYFKENGYSIEAGKKAFKYYDVADWKDAKGNQVKNWKQKMISVWFKEENKGKGNSFNINDYS